MNMELNKWMTAQHRKGEKRQINMQTNKKQKTKTDKNKTKYLLAPAKRKEKKKKTVLINTSIFMKPFYMILTIS